LDAIEKLKMLTEDQGLRKRLAVCYQCGMCTGGCPVSHAKSEYNPRRILETLILGQYAELVSSQLIWLCLSCNSCMERCPQRIEISDLFVDLKNAAAESGNIPKLLLERAKRIAETGQSTPNSKASLVWREKLGLAPSSQVNVEEVRTLLEAAQFPGSVERRRDNVNGARS
jgi:heterodisulfide reductase subunit C